MPFVQLADIELHVLDEGRGPGAVVLLHAFPLHAEMWRPQIERLAKRTRVVAPDLRGFGRTAQHPDVIEMSALAEDVWQMCDVLGIARAVVCGMSMGGYVSFPLYRRAPQLFAGLVLADTRATADTAEGRAGREALAQKTLANGIDWVAEDSTPKLLARGADPAVVAEVRRIIREGRPSALAAGLRGMALRGDATGELGRITCPTLVIVGREDEMTPPSGAEAMAAAIPGARLEVIDHAGHLSNLESPEVFGALVERLAEATGMLRT